MSEKKIRCLLFDLDGTLIDSRADLASSVNLTLAEMQLDVLPRETIVNFIGEGVANLLRRSISASKGQEAYNEEIETGVAVFRKHYAQHALDETKLFDGVSETLNGLRDYQKAVVTNKPLDFSLKILEGLNVLQHFKVVFGGDSFIERKPSPVPLFEAAKICEATPQECLMIGDSRVDIEAGKNAGMKTCGLTFGFRGRDELEKAGADILIDSFSELLQFL